MLSERFRSARWQARLKLADSSWRRVSTGETDSVAAGNVSVVQQPKRVKAWFWAVDGGKVCVAVKYGNKVVELAKGRTVVGATVAELTATLAILRKALETGEIDAQIVAVSAGVRRCFKK